MRWHQWPRRSAIALLVCLVALAWPTSAAAQNPVNALYLRLGVTGTTALLRAGAGSPEGVVTAPVGTQYLNITDGKWWRKASGTGNTGWVLLVVPAGSSGDVQLNVSGVFGVDTGVFTYNTSTHTLGANNISSQTGSDLAIIGAAGTTVGRNITITAGTSNTTAGGAGSVTISGGSVIGGTSTTAGSVTIKSGDVQNTIGQVVITTGALPATGYASPGTGLTVKPATPPTDVTNAVGGTGIGVLVEGGPGGASNSGALSNGTGGAAGPLTLKSGTGGTVAGNNNTRTGGAGALLSIYAGAGGAATGAGAGTLTGGAGGSVEIGSGAGGTGEDGNGAAGTMTLKIGANTALLVNANREFIVCGDTGTTGQVLTANSGGCPTWEAAGGTPAALTKTDDTNVTLTLGGSPTTAVLQATSLTLGWAGQLALSRGGTAANLTAVNGGAVYSTGSALGITAAGTTGQVLTSQGAAPPIWTTIGGTGTVTSVAATVPTGLSISGSPITTSGTLAIALAAGYMIPGGGTDGYHLRSNGAGVAPTWEAVGGGGSVSSVAMTVPTGLSISGSPVTSTGTLAVSLTSGYMIPGGGTAGQSLRSNGASAPTFAFDTSTSAYGSSPGSPLTSDLWFPNDSFYALRYSGSAWAPWGPIFPMTPPVDGDFSWVNQGSASVTTTNGGIYLLGPAGSGENNRIRVKTAPSTPYTITAAFLVDGQANNYRQAGLLFREVATGELSTIALTSHSGSPTGWYIILSRWNNPTTYGPADYTFLPYSFGSVVWFQISDNGTNRIYRISGDGQNWTQVHSVSRTDHLTADQVGFMVNCNNATYACGMTLLSWKQSTTGLPGLLVILWWRRRFKARGMNASVCLAVGLTGLVRRCGN